MPRDKFFGLGQRELFRVALYIWFTSFTMPRYTNCLNWPRIYIYIYVCVCVLVAATTTNAKSIAYILLPTKKWIHCVLKTHCNSTKQDKIERTKQRNLFFFFFLISKKKRSIKCKRDVISSGQMTIKSPMQQNCLHYSNFLRWINLARITINAKVMFCYQLRNESIAFSTLIETVQNKTK